MDNPFEPTPHPIGSPQRLEVMAARRRARLPLVLPGDCDQVDPNFLESQSRPGHKRSGDGREYLEEGRWVVYVYLPCPMRPGKRTRKKLPGRYATRGAARRAWKKFLGQD